MSEQKNIPAKAGAQDVVTHAGQAGSLVMRGMTALLSGKDPSLAEDYDEIYHRARSAYDYIIELGDKSGFGIAWTRSDLDHLDDAMEAFKKLADCQYGKSYLPLSLIYSGGRSFPVHRENAQRYAKLALEWCTANQHRDDPEVWNDLGRLHWLNEESGPDYAQALLWYQKAADRGNAQAQYNLGSLYYNGQGVAQDYAQAAAWYEKSASQGHTRAQYALGGMHYNEQGVAQDYEQAVAWYRKAAEQGHANDQHNLGNAYAYGRGQ